MKGKGEDEEGGRNRGKGRMIRDKKEEENKEAEKSSKWDLNLRPITCEIITLPTAHYLRLVVTSQILIFMT